MLFDPNGFHDSFQGTATTPATTATFSGFLRSDIPTFISEGILQVNKTRIKRTLLPTAIILGLTGSIALGQTDRRWDGSANSRWDRNANWSGNNLPNSVGERAVMDGANNGTTLINLAGGNDNFTIGSFQVLSPATVTRVRSFSGANSLTLSPSAFYSDVGIEMSSATVDWSFIRGRQDWNIYLASSQDWNVTSTSADGDLFIADRVVVNLGAHTLTANAGTGRQITIASVIRDTGNIDKIGDGTMIFSNANNTYSGTTTVTAGILELDNAGTNNNIADSTIIEIASPAELDVNGLNSGRLDLVSGQTLQGSGTVDGDLTALSGSEIMPGTGGSGVGTLDVTGTGVLTLDSGSLTTFDINTSTDIDGPTAALDANVVATVNALAGTAYPQADTDNEYDQIVANTVNLTAGGTILVSPLSFAPVKGMIYQLFNSATINQGSFLVGDRFRSGSNNAGYDLKLPNLTPLSSSGSLRWDTSLFISDGILIIVPEPSRALLLLIGCSAVIFRRQRRNQTVLGSRF